MKHSLFSFMTILLAINLISCNSSNNPFVTREEDKSRLKIEFATENKPEAVVKMTATLSRDGFDSIEKNFSINEETTSVLFENVIVGAWLLTINAYDNNNILLFKGEKQVDIIAGQLTVVDIDLEPVPQQGGLLVNIKFKIDTSLKYTYDFNSGDLSEWDGTINAEIYEGMLHIWGKSGYLWRTISPYNTYFSKGQIEFDIKVTSGALCAFATKGGTLTSGGAQDYGVKMHWRDHFITIDQHDGTQRYVQSTNVPYEDNLWYHMKFVFDNNLGEKGKFSLWMKPETSDSLISIGEFDHLAQKGKLFGINVFDVGVYNFNGTENKHAYFDNFEFNVIPINN